MIEAYRKLGEVITERINEERKSLYRRSKTVEASMHIGLTAIGSGISSYLPYPELVSLISILFTGIQIGFQERIRASSRWLVEKWPFAEKGVPFSALHPLEIQRGIEDAIKESQKQI